MVKKTHRNIKTAAETDKITIELAKSVFPGQAIGNTGRNINQASDNLAKEHIIVQRLKEDGSYYGISNPNPEG